MVSKLDLIKALALALAARYPWMTSKVATRAATKVIKVGGLPMMLAAYAVVTNPQRPDTLLQVEGEGVPDFDVRVGYTPQEEELFRITGVHPGRPTPLGPQAAGQIVQATAPLVPFGRAFSSTAVALAKRKITPAQKRYNRAVKKGLSIIKQSKEIGKKGVIKDPRRAFRRATQAAALAVKTKTKSISAKAARKTVVSLARKIKRWL